MTPQDDLAARFEQDRTHLKAVAYRMLGSVGEAEDAVQEAWFRLSRSDTSEVANLTGWLTTVVGRVCLDVLRARRARPELPLDRLPDPVVERPGPAAQAELADSIGIALLVVLDALTPAERLAYVLHDMFGLPFDEIAPMVDRSPEATRQLASRARRRIQGRPVPDTGVEAQRSDVDAYNAAARGGDLDGLVAVLHPDAVLRSDRGTGRLRVVQGARAVASSASAFQSVGGVEVHAEPAIVNGAAGIVATRQGRPYSVLAFTIVDERIVEIDVLADPDRLATLDLADLA
jgi:RNA polymerase sigma-70 factor (ECF subfamily)